MPRRPEAAAQLRAAAHRFESRVGHWDRDRWAIPVPGSPASPVSGSPVPTRADAVHALAQKLADLGADATGRPRRPVPRLSNDLALVSQIRVLVLDLLDEAPAETLSAATAAFADLRL